MFSVLVLGLLLGLQHALEADHLAAVASLSSRGGRLRDAARHGAAWGLGHATTLLLLGGTLLLIDSGISPQIAQWLEALVGLMLIALGADVLLRLWRKQVHFHVHHHGPRSHFHAHSHAPGADHAEDPHHHRHIPTLPRRALLVGMMHGLAGTAALLVFALGSVNSVGQALAYLLVFGLGSTIGMTLLAVAVSVPLRWSANSLTWAHNGLTLVLGLFTVTLGGVLLHQSGSAALGLAGI